MDIAAYREHLNRWAVARLSQDQHWEVIARFRSWSDAEGHLQLLRQKMPHASMKVMFDLVESGLESGLPTSPESSE